MYLTYEEYLDYGGLGALDVTTFNRYEFEAECYIDWYTFDRLSGETTYSEPVKKCAYMLVTLIDEKYRELSATDPNAKTSAITDAVSQQSNDGVSVSYATLNTYGLLTYAKKEVEDAINFCLRGAVNRLGRRLLYRGLYPGE